MDQKRSACSTEETSHSRSLQTLRHSDSPVAAACAISGVTKRSEFGTGKSHSQFQHMELSCSRCDALSFALQELRANPAAEVPVGLPC